MKNLILDFGNSYLKLALFEGETLVHQASFSTLKELIEEVHTQTFEKALLSSVIKASETSLFLNQMKKEIDILDVQKTQFPIEIQYKTPLTLGKDRIANACFASKQNPNRHSLIIDIGTCIKFDFLELGKKYKGGSISPGLNLRFKSLNNYTGNLPLITLDGAYDNLIGIDTEGSILSGVKIGMEAEINGMIQMYEDQFKDLTIFITGGDADKFELKAKNTIFADHYITLKGLNEILLFNK